MSCNFKTLGKFTMKENFCAIFGNKILKSLIDFNKKEEHCKFIIIDFIILHQYY